VGRITSGSRTCGSAGGKTGQRCLGQASCGGETVVGVVVGVIVGVAVGVVVGVVVLVVMSRLEPWACGVPSPGRYSIDN